MGITIENIKQAIHKIDLIQRPFTIFVNPADAKTIKDAFPDIEEMVEVKETDFVEKGKIIRVNRERMEKWSNNDFGYTWSELE